MARFGAEQSEDASLQSLCDAIIAVMRDAPPTIDRIARAQQTSVRTLQRRLAALGTTHSDLVDRARFEMASRLLRESDHPLRWVARRLRFADPGSFSRAFRRWAGCTPREFRRRHTDERIA